MSSPVTNPYDNPTNVRAQVSRFSLYNWEQYDRRSRYRVLRKFFFAIEVTLEVLAAIRSDRRRGIVVQKYLSLSLGALEINSRRFQTGWAPARWFCVPIVEDEEDITTEEEDATDAVVFPASVSASGM